MVSIKDNQTAVKLIDKIAPAKRAFRIMICSTALSFGGEQKQIAKALAYLDRKQFQPVICCIRPHGYVEPAILNSNTTLTCLQVRGRYNLFGAVRGLCRVIKQQDIDLIHTGIFGSEFAELIAARLRHVPVVALLTTMYDIEQRLASSPAKEFTARRKWWVIRQVHAILSRIVNVRYVAYSQAIKESAVKNFHLPAGHVEVLPLGINPDDFDDSLLSPESFTQLKDELNINGAYPVLLNVARQSMAKGQKALLEAMPRVLERFPHARLLIAGDGPLKDELEKVRDKLGLREHVSLLGRRNDVAGLLALSDIFVFSSHYEGLPGAVMEAMAAGKPVVAFDIPALRELIQDKECGVLVQGRDTRRFADAVIRLAEKKEMAGEMGDRGRRIVKERYHIEQNIKLLEELYLKMLAKA